MSGPLTIQQAIDIILRRVPGHRADTVDTVKSGDPSAPLRGVVTTFMATRTVLGHAVELDANLVITHEPTYYNHRDETTRFANDRIYLSKQKFLEDHRIVVWRFHDYWHKHQPDGILTGVLRELAWEACADATNPNIYRIKPITLEALARFFKERLNIQLVRMAGDPQMVCATVGLLPGAWGGERQIKLLGTPGVDVVVCGESSEWETCEYVRDAAAAGEKKGLLILGHCNSEEAGMKWLAEWMRPMVPGIPVTFVPAGDPFQYV